MISGLRWDPVQKVKSGGGRTNPGQFPNALAGSDCWQTVPPSYIHRHSTISSTAASGRSKLGFQVPKLPSRWEHRGAEKEGFWLGDRHNSQPLASQSLRN